jgi:hypothetical protein
MAPAATAAFGRRRLQEPWGSISYANELPCTPDTTAKAELLQSMRLRSIHFGTFAMAELSSLVDWLNLHERGSPA